jgi:hydroxyethylthiazole kinase-like sugar kinase family protein
VANPSCGQQTASLVFTLALTRALQADLADRDFTAERHQVIVISTGAVDPIEQQRSLAERKETEDRHRHRWAGGCLSPSLPACQLACGAYMQVHTAAAIHDLC